MLKNRLVLLFILLTNLVVAQSFYFGADMSYLNEMEDCGVVYYEEEKPKDPYAIFENHGCNLVRLRLWHTPSWYDALNEGKRYSDLADVKVAIRRAKENKLQVLLDFHLSDNWADPSKQLVPKAWLPIVDNTSILKDSLYNYIFNTLSDLQEQQLLPDLIQIGNETNKGILLSPTDNATWTLDWERNATLFNEAIKAVNDFEQLFEEDLKIVLHVAGPDNAEWLIKEFMKNQVTDFDIIGLSYYWAWHQPATITETGKVIQRLRNLYPDKEVVIVETGYIWTTDGKDDANNIISETHPDYHPASPINQRNWLIDLTKEVIEVGGSGVIYWEPCWLSSACYTQWGQGSHQEHATFFDFNNNLLLPGGIEWMEADYNLTTAITELSSVQENKIQIITNSQSGEIIIKQFLPISKKLHFIVSDTVGNLIVGPTFFDTETSFNLTTIPFGIYIVTVKHGELVLKSEKVMYR